MYYKDDLSGIKYGKLTVVCRILKNKRGLWLCTCECGNTCTVLTNKLKSGQKSHCGCSNKLIKHGLWKTREFKCWECMKNRCSGREKRYQIYIDNGISVCEEWKNDFLRFYTDMGKSPSEQHTLDRIDNTKGYYKDNCRWATKKQQSRNTSKNVILSYNGRSMCLSDWSDYLSIPRYVLATRYRKLGWSAKKTLTTPVKKYKKSSNPKLPV